MKQCIEAAKILVRRIAQDLESIEADIRGRGRAPLFTFFLRLAAEDEREEKVINGSCEQLGIASGGPQGREIVALIESRVPLRRSDKYQSCR
jgi:hypothetical protein